MTELAPPPPKPKAGSMNARLSMARLAAVQCVYQWLHTDSKKIDEVIEYYRHHYEGLHVDGEVMLTPEPKLFLGVVKGVEKRLDDLENIINQFIKKDSEAFENKKDLLILSVLYCGAYELMAHHEIDAPIIISDYMHITRSFYEGAQPKLVNAVLDNLKKELRV